MNLFDFFQITVLIVFYAVFIGRTLQMLMRGVNPLALGSSKRGLERALELSFAIGLAGWTMEIISHSLRLERHILPDVLYIQMFDITPLRILGALLIVAGLGLFVLSLISFGNSWRIGIDTRSAGDLVTTGAFSISRNPIFLFLDAYFLGSWLIYPNLFFGMFAIVAVAGIHRQILQEERFLTEKHGEAYREYRGKVRRYM